MGLPKIWEEIILICIVIIPKKQMIIFIAKQIMKQWREENMVKKRQNI